ncbi:glutaminase A [Oscillatoria sp. FACHB-1407]|uniref:glutaminase A n=1 Tax=Oscillatoria sp. FACHB-1407 TaxID=2692847 RepID=UPI0016825797|nr:glutaminase A [Oscillatoria sp. FACHB-1407]MBD2465086.1 glutaminase A [Oscillatoria sp. FACHB-1407]
MSHFDNLHSLTSSITAVTSPLRQYLHELHSKYHPLTDGVVANYIPELALADPALFGIAVVTTDGQIFEVGDSTTLFTSQAISKAFVYGLALEDHGRDYITSKVGLEATGEAFNAILLDEKNNRPYNPMVNGGAIAITNLIKGQHPTERLKRILDMFKRYTGHSHDISMPVFLSEKATGHRNRAMAFLMLNVGIVSDNLEETLDLYFQQCSILVTARDLAMMGATLANGGVNPITQERAIDAQYVQDVISVMLTCGMYNYSGEWACRVGIPAKSGVGGGITAVVPGQLGIGTFSPLLDDKGNSIRGIKVYQDLSKDFGLHLFNATRCDRDLNAWTKGSPVDARS